MKKSQIVILGFLGLGLLDSLITFGFPIDFTYADYSFIPHFTFIGMLVYLNDKSWLNRILISVCIGLFFDILFANSFGFYMLLFGAAGFLIGTCNRYMTTDQRKFLVIFVFTILFDLVPYCLLRIFSQYYPSFITWFLHMELLTIILDSVEILFLMYIEQVMSRFFKIRNLREQKRVRQKIKQVHTSRR